MSLTPVEFLAHVAVRRAQLLEEFITQLSAETDELEESLLTDGDDPQLKRLSVLRYQAFSIRRQLVPLRDLLNFIITDNALQISKEEASSLTLATEQIVRYLESLDDCRERTQLLHDQIAGQLAAMMSRVSYNLTVVATVFLPLSFITGLLGMNVAGIQVVTFCPSAIGRLPKREDERRPAGWKSTC